MKRLLLTVLIALSLTLTACTTNKQTYFLQRDNATGILYYYDNQPSIIVDFNYPISLYIEGIDVYVYFKDKNQYKLTKHRDVYMYAGRLFIYAK